MTSIPRAIFFDVGNTLLFPAWEEILLPLAQRREEVTSSLLLNAERSAKLQLDRNMALSGKVDQRYWAHFFDIVLRQMNIDAAHIHLELVKRVRASANWTRLVEGTPTVIKALAKEFRLGVISNADGTVDRQLRISGLAEYFEVIVDSGSCGIEKPDAAIFLHAANLLGIAPKDCLYIGDVYSIDYVGAMNAGMNAILFDSSRTYNDSQTRRIHSLRELEDLLL